MSDNTIRLADRIKEISYTMGTGNMALAGAVAGFSSFASKFNNNDAVFYAITDGSTYEVGSGVFLSSPYSQIVRFPIVSSSSNNRVNFAEGIKEVYVTYPATHAVYTGSGVGNLNTPETNNIAVWASPNVLDSTSNLTWNKEFNRLGVNHNAPDYGIHVGGVGAESIVKASGFLVGSSGIYFQPYGSYSGGLQLTHHEKNQLDQYALSQGLIGQLTGTSAVFDLSGVANQYFLFKKQTAGLVFAGPASGCTPPCSPAYPSFRQLTIDDVPAITQVSGILNNKIFTMTAASNSTTLAVSGILNNKINAVSGLFNNFANTLNGDRGDVLVTNSGTLWTIDTNAVTNAKIADSAITANKLSYTNSHIACGRLTLESNNPVSMGDQSAKSVVYYTPHTGSVISLYNTSTGKWDTINFIQTSITLSGLISDRNYDIFGYNNAGTLTLELNVWTNDTTRSISIVTQDGVYCKSGDLSRRYLGTIRTTSSNTTADTLSQRLVWNMSNRVRRKVFNPTAAGPWTYSTSTWRALNNTQTKIDIVCGLSSLIEVTGGILYAAPQSAATVSYYLGVAKNGSNTPLTGTRHQSYNDAVQVQLIANLLDHTTIGYQAYYPVEYAVTTTTIATLYGGNNNSYFGGIYGTWEC
jgi:hypothetical protein